MTSMSRPSSGPRHQRHGSDPGHGDHARTASGAPRRRPGREGRYRIGGLRRTNCAAQGPARIHPQRIRDHEFPAPAAIVRSNDHRAVTSFDTTISCRGVVEVPPAKICRCSPGRQVAGSPPSAPPSHHSGTGIGQRRDVHRDASGRDPSRVGCLLPPSTEGAERFGPNLHRDRRHLFHPILRYPGRERSFGVLKMSWIPAPWPRRGRRG